MKIKIEFLQNIAREVKNKQCSLTLLMDKFDVVAEEKDIADLVEALRCFADVVESIKIHKKGE